MKKTIVNKKEKLIIIGASGHGKVVADIAIKNGYRDIVFLDDNRNLKYCGSFPVVGRCSEAENIAGKVIIAIGNAVVRKRIQENIDSSRVISLIHPCAVISDDVEIGIGSVVMAGAVINPGTIIGNGCIVNTASSIDHDCAIGNYVHIAIGAHIAGNVEIGRETWIGAGAIVSNNIDICNNCIIGAGAVVIKNIRRRGTYIGLPAKKRKADKNENSYFDE